MIIFCGLQFQETKSKVSKIYNDVIVNIPVDLNAFRQDSRRFNRAIILTADFCSTNILDIFVSPQFPQKMILYEIWGCIKPK